MDPQLRRDPKYQNFVTVFRGFAYVGNVLEPYTVAGLQKAYQKAYRASAGFPSCSQQCSLTHRRNTSAWCGTCKAWRNTLRHERRGPYNNWENTESWNWSASYDNNASVFLPSFWNPNDIKFNEFGTACHMWTNCKEFNIGNALLKKARELRNKHYGHNPDLKLENAEKTKVFDTLKNIIAALDVQAYLNVGQCIQDLDIIAKGDELKEFMDDIEEQVNKMCVKIDSNDTTQKMFASIVKREITRQNEILGAVKKQLGNDNRRRLLKEYVICLSVFAIVVCGMLTYDKHSTGSLMYQQDTECFSETYSYPFPQDLHLLPYFEEHSKLFGRNWLFEDIEKYTEDNGLPEKGILITADMGYGKSAIVKHMLCTQKDEKAYKIRQQIVAFHLCRFDVPATNNPQRFIHRLVGFLSTHLPEYGALISSLEETSLLFDDKKCRKEIVACFDQGILHPLLKMKTIEKVIRIIVIDALDECYDKRSKNNELYDLLKVRYKNLPKWMKLIITSRNISFIHTMHHLKHFSLDSGDLRNKKDIMQYIEYKASLFPVLRNFKGGLDTVLDQSEGLFLVVVHLLDYMTTHDYGKGFEFPETLSGVYEMNFERHFHSEADYKIARTILEIVIASLHPLSNTDVANILENLNISRKDTTEINFEKIAFCFRSLQELTLVHQSVQLWLLSSEDSNMFHVSAEREHAMLSQYLLNQMNRSRTDIVDIAIHIGNSNDTTLEKVFTGTYSNNNMTKSALHRLVWKSDIPRALELLLNLQIDTDTLNKDNVTPAFVAAARGHLNQLKLLKSRGADLNFKVNDFYLITSLSQIDVIKHEYYFGYGLIHIAANFGHFKIVSFLLEQNKTLRHDTNGLGLTVAEIACENGHENILELISKSKAGVGNCLYYAAKNKRIHIVNRLIRFGVNASCISQTDATDAYAKLRAIDMSHSVFTLHPDDEHHQLFNLNDLWWVVNQESPLHASIKANSEETAIALIKHYPHLKDCVDAFGMTPFLLSVTENLTKVFEILVERVTTDTCRTASVLRHVQPGSFQPVCPVGGSYVHLDGIYGRFDLTQIIYDKGFVIDWLVPDTNSISAAHYAACNGNMLFLSVFQKMVNQSLSDIRSENRSSPYHSAAICGSLGALFVMKRSPELYDIQNKTLLHYTVMREFTGCPALVDAHEQEMSKEIVRELLDSGKDIEASDSSMRNILHYALENGHYYIIQYLLHCNASISFVELIKQRDIYGRSPVAHALKNSNAPLKVNIPPIEIDSKCFFYDLFSPCCVPDDQYNEYLSSWELALVTVLKGATEEVMDDFSSAFNIIFVKSPLLTATSLLYLKDRLPLGLLRKHVIESLSSVHGAVLLSMYVVARHRPMVFKRCGKSISESPLHYMAYGFMADETLGNFIFLQLAFGKSFNTNALECADNRGYNCFHYALMGGNIRTAKLLFDNGVSVTNKKVSIQDIPWMMVLARGKQNINNDLDYVDYYNSMDNLLHNILINVFEQNSIHRCVFEQFTRTITFSRLGCTRYEKFIESFDQHFRK